MITMPDRHDHDGAIEAITIRGIRTENVDAYREASRLRYAAYDAARALARLGERVEWPEGMYAPGGAVAA